MRVAYDSSAEPGTKLDKVPQMVDNDGHGSDTNNPEFCPTRTDY